MENKIASFVSLALLVFISILFISIFACAASAEENSIDGEATEILIRVGEEIYQATLYDNETAKAFAQMLPLELDMSELNGNEKYFYLPENLPADGSYSGNIRTGDLMLYGDSCLVLFYENFHSRYNYSQLGFVEDPEGLADALGSGGVHVIFSLPENENEEKPE